MIESLPEKPTESQQNAVLQLLSAIEELLPCSECQWHFRQHRITHPLTVPFSRETASIWLWKCHNAVNQRQGKPQILRDEQQKGWQRRSKYPRTIISYEDSEGKSREFHNNQGQVPQRSFHFSDPDTMYNTIRRSNVMSAYIWESISLVVAGILFLIFACQSVYRQRQIHNRNHIKKE